MRKFIAILGVSITFIGCSLKTPPDSWRIESMQYLSGYEENFLKANDVMSHFYLKEALSSAKVSADLSVLQNIYLYECALNRSVGKLQGCQDFKKVLALAENEANEVYFAFINKKPLTNEQIEKLPKRYRVFAYAFASDAFNTAKEEIFKTSQVSSRFIMAQLIKEHLDNESRQKLIDLASLYGYKKMVLYWLHQRYMYEHNRDKKERILAKIELLRSN